MWKIQITTKNYWLIWIMLYIIMSIFRDCLVTTLVNCFTSFFSGFVIFTYLGFMSHKQGVPISSVATEGNILYLFCQLDIQRRYLFLLTRWRLLNRWTPTACTKKYDSLSRSTWAERASENHVVIIYKIQKIFIKVCIFLSMRKIINRKTAHNLFLCFVSVSLFYVK